MDRRGFLGALVVLFISPFCARQGKADMAVATNNFTTGPSTLLDVGTLSYNGCIFSPLFESSVAGIAVKDNAQRTVKYMEYTITVDGYVTLPAGSTSIGPTTTTLRELLTAQGGDLVYQGRGCDLVVNPAGGGDTRDVAWGPVPELFEFQPLGGGLSAKIRWQVKTRLPEAVANVAVAGLAGRLLQFNYETVVSYGEDGYSALQVRGTLEIPLTRNTQKTRTIPYTADNLRTLIETRIMSGIDLTRFHFTRRTFTLSRDKRTLEWDIAVEEKPYMDLPEFCPVARGTYSVRPAKAGMGLVTWLCTLRATYIVRGVGPGAAGGGNLQGPFPARANIRRQVHFDDGSQRRQAWFRFLELLRLRMLHSEFGNLAGIEEGEQNPGNPGKAATGAFLGKTLRSALAWSTPAWFPGQNQQIKQAQAKKTSRAFLLDFSFDEGLYLDSKSISFSASWRLITTFSHILIASGVWRKLPEKDQRGRSHWVTSMAGVAGVQSWLPNDVDPALDMVVDFGGG